MNLGHHHYTHHYIKNQKKFDLLHSKKSVKRLDRMVLVIGILSPLFTLPQVWQIWTTHDVEGINLITWIAWATFNGFWFVYSVAHKELPLIVNCTIWIFIYISVITGIIIFR